MTADPRRIEGYLPIADYGIIGDCRSIALVGVDGSIDWCCLPRFDSPSIFARVLDQGAGGSWRIAPVDAYQSRQSYADNSNTLRTIFETSGGKALVTDFMPVDAPGTKQHARPHRHPRIVRIVAGLAGSTAFHSHFDPQPGYAGAPAAWTVDGGNYHADVDGQHYCFSCSQPLSGPDQTFTVAAGETVVFALTVNRRGQCGVGIGNDDRARRLLRTTQLFWWDWIMRCTYRGPYAEAVWRSALLLKVLTYAPTGAIIAAPTTSLPEWIGGPRNWDYRFTWLRDASFTLYSLFQLGYQDEAQDFMHWLRHLAIDRGLKILYNLDGRAGNTEQTLPHLSGYRDSRPVRVGNGAEDQLQIDIYGELLDSAYLYAVNGGTIDATLWRELTRVVDFATEMWQLPDASLWEVRGPYQHFTYGKAMCWAALDRGIKIAQLTRHPAPLARWRRIRNEIHAAVLREGYSTKLRSFTQTFGGEALDASALRLVQLGFLPHHDRRLKSTIKAVDRELSAGPLVYRYRVDETDDGLNTPEGSFLITAFWLADALALVGDLEGAQRRFERLLQFSSPLGLLSEEVHPMSGELLGNYPQAFSHLALISAAVNIERRRQDTLRRGPEVRPRRVKGARLASSTRRRGSGKAGSGRPEAAAPSGSAARRRR